MMVPGCSWEFDGVIGLSETLCVFDVGLAAGHGSSLPDSERVALADYMIGLWSRFRERTDIAELPADEEVLIPLYDAFRAMDRALQSVHNMPRSAGAHGPIFAEQERARARAEAIAVKLSQLTAIGSFWPEIYSATMVSHCFYRGGDAADALQVLAKANALDVVDES